MDKYCKMIQLLCKENIINIEECEIVEFGLRQGLVIISGILLALLAGIKMEITGKAIFFLLCFIPLRIYAGGFHTKTRKMCYILSVVSILLSYHVLKTGFSSTLFIAGFCFISMALIWKMAPVDSKNRKLCKDESKTYRRRTHIILILLLLTYLITLVLARDLGICIAMACLLEAISMAAAVLDKIKSDIYKFIYKYQKMKGITL